LETGEVSHDLYDLTAGAGLDERRRMDDRRAPRFSGACVSEAGPSRVHEELIDGVVEIRGGVGSLWQQACEVLSKGLVAESAVLTAALAGGVEERAQGIAGTDGGGIGR
jgi:hypothetical protein